MRGYTGPVWSFATYYLDITPEEGTIGTAVIITGNNFGTSEGKVVIGGVTLSVLSWGNGEIHASLGKVLAAGTYSVTVQPKIKGASPITGASLFTVRPPEIDLVSPHSGSPGQSVTINGKFFGTKKGKVLLEYVAKGKTKTKSCKITTWTMTEIGFGVPKGLAAGTYPLKVTNSVDEATGEFRVVLP